MPGIKSLRRVQLGKETTSGTRVSATTIWRGTGTLKDDTQVVHPNEDVGIIVETDRTYIPAIGGTLTLDATPATFEQLPYVLNMGIKGVASTQDGAGSGYVYTYALPTTTKVSPYTYSVEGGDDQQAEFGVSAFCESFKLSGKINAAIEMSAVIKTRSAVNIGVTAATIAATSTNTLADSGNGFAFSTGGGRLLIFGTTLTGTPDGTVLTYTAATTSSVTGITPAFSTTFIAGSTITVEQWFSTASLPAVEDILFQKAKLYIDVSTGTAGTTLKSNTLLGFDLDVKTGNKGQSAADGNLYFSFVKTTQPTGTLKLTFEHDGKATAEKAAWRAGTGRLVRLIVQGTALTTAGTYTYKTLIIDLIGKWREFSALTDDNGNDTVTGTLEFAYNATAGSAGQILVVNQLSALP